MTGAFRKGQAGLFLLEAVLCMAIMMMLGSVATWSYLNSFQMQRREKTMDILERAREAYLEIYEETGVKPVSCAVDCSADKTKCVLPAGLAARMGNPGGVDGWGQPLLLWTDITVSGQTYDAVICSSRGNRDYGNVPDANGVLTCSDSEAMYAFIRIPANNRRREAQIAVDTAAGVWAAARGTINDPGCDGNPWCVETMANNGLIGWEHVIDPWGSPIKYIENAFVSAGPDKCYGASDPDSFCGEGSDADNINSD